MVKQMVIYRLRQLEKLGWAEEDLAKALKITPASLERLKTGKAGISATTELELGKLLSQYVRKKMIESGHRPPKVIHRRSQTPLPAPPAIEPPNPKRGVYLEDVPAPGETWYKVILSNGKVGIVHLPSELVDE